MNRCIGTTVKGHFGSGWRAIFKKVGSSGPIDNTPVIIVTTDQPSKRQFLNSINNDNPYPVSCRIESGNKLLAEIVLPGSTTNKFDIPIPLGYDFHIGTSPKPLSRKTRKTMKKYRCKGGGGIEILGGIV